MSRRSALPKKRFVEGVSDAYFALHHNGLWRAAAFKVGDASYNEFASKTRVASHSRMSNAAEERRESIDLDRIGVEKAASRNY
jgi:hypothetical protein